MPSEVTAAPFARGRGPARRSQAPMLSRTAHSLYWLGRYIERAENIARLVDVNLLLQLDFEHCDDRMLTEHWRPILGSAGDEELFRRLGGAEDSRGITEFLSLSPANPNSILSCVAAARENARTVRDQITIEMWEVLNGLHLFVQSDEARRLWERGDGAFFARLKNDSQLFQGITNAGFTRDTGYDFLQLGKFSERTDKTIRILDLKYHILLPDAREVGGAVDTAQWRAVLRSASALEAYRHFYVSEILPWKVAEFLLFSETFPRSVRFGLGRIDHYVHQIGGRGSAAAGAGARRICGRLLAEFSAASIEAVIRQGLHEYLVALLPQLQQIADDTNDSFMAYTTHESEAEVRLHQQEEQQQQSPSPE